MNTQDIILIANGDLRSSANQKCEEAQRAMEAQLITSIEKEGRTVRRGHDYNPKKGHSFIDSQKYGMEVFRSIPKNAPLIVAEAVWQYSHHLLHGLLTHEGPILTVANWSGTWPGLVGMLNLNGSLTKAGVKYSTLWSEDFTDKVFLAGLRTWLTTGSVTHKTGHVRSYEKAGVPPVEEKLGTDFAKKFREHKAIMGVFDEGCMGMFNAIIPDELIHKTGVFKERLSQSSLYACMLTVKDEEALAIYQWLLDRGMTFVIGTNEETDLTEKQILAQCKMYIAAMRIADEFGCSTIGIQYQQGLKDLAPASDLVEGLLNNVERPPVYNEAGEELFAGEALPHFNEVDECSGLDGLITYKLWRELGFDPENTLHDLRWGRHYKGPGGKNLSEELDAYIWVFLISGAAPPAHFVDGFKGTSSERQPSMYFRLGGGTVKGISKPGWIVWSRIFIDDGVLCYDTGLGEIVALPEAETQDRWNLSTPQWPIMHAILPGISRDEMMARHQANHIQVVYAPDKEGVVSGLYAKAAAMRELGMKVAICGEI